MASPLRLASLYMNLHALIDEVGIANNALFKGRHKYFVRSLDSPSLAEMTRAITVELPHWSATGAHEVQLQTLAGPTDPAFRVASWLGPGRPVIIYHHGSGERPLAADPPLTDTFHRILFNADPPLEASLIALRSPFYQGSQRDYMRTVADLSKFVAQIASSTRLMEALTARCHALGSKVIIGGLSLGGWVTNLHRALYGTADAYVPLLAGAALDELFLTSAYRHLTARSARAQPQSLRAALNFEALYAKRQEDNVFPLLAEHDRLAVYTRQRQAYASMPLTLLGTGHLTAAADARAMRGPFERALAAVRNSAG